MGRCEKAKTSVVEVVFNRWLERETLEYPLLL